MKLYRMRGRADLLGSCGLLFIDPLVDSSLTRLTKEAKKIVAQYKKEKRTCIVWLEQLDIQPLTVELAVDLLTKNDTELLVAACKTLQTLEHKEA